MTRRLRKAALALVVTVSALAALDGLAWLGEVLAYGAPYDGARPRGLYKHAQGQRPGLQPGARLDGLLYSIHINSLGFRGPELAVPKPHNGLRVWCTGGSTTFDIFFRSIGLSMDVKYWLTDWSKDSALVV